MRRDGSKEIYRRDGSKVYIEKSKLKKNKKRFKQCKFTGDRAERYMLRRASWMFSCKHGISDTHIHTHTHNISGGQSAGTYHARHCDTCIHAQRARMDHAATSH